MTPTHKSFLKIIAIISLVTGAFFMWRDDMVTKAALPPIEFTDAAGAPVTLADFKGSPVLLHFWATWCAPCIKEFPSLQKLQEEYGSKGFKIVALSLDTDMEKARAFYAAHGVSQFPLYSDAGYKNFRVLGLNGVPSSILISRDGREIHRFRGETDWQSWTVAGALTKAVSP